jgi:hypothetical protein
MDSAGTSNRTFIYTATAAASLAGVMFALRRAFAPATALAARRTGARGAALSTSASASADATAKAKRFKVYTKTGDKGTTSLYNLQRAEKTSAYFSALGDSDELIAHIGVARVAVVGGAALSLPLGG